MLNSQYLERIKKKYYFFYLNGIDTSNKILNDFLVYNSFQSSLIHGCEFNYQEAYNYLTNGYTSTNKELFDYIILSNIYNSQKWFYSLFNNNFDLDIETIINLNNHLLIGIEYRIKEVAGYKIKKKIIKGKLKNGNNPLNYYFLKEENLSNYNLFNSLRVMLENIHYSSNITLPDIVDFYVSFLSLSPFDMANGRTLRIIINYLFFKANLPFISFKKEDKDFYINAIKEYNNGNKSLLINLFENYLENNSILSFSIYSNTDNYQIINEHIP